MVTAARRARSAALSITVTWPEIMSLALATSWVIFSLVVSQVLGLLLQGLADLIGLRGGAHRGAAQLLGLLAEGAADAFHLLHDVVGGLLQTPGPAALSDLEISATRAPGIPRPDRSWPAIWRNRRSVWWSTWLARTKYSMQHPQQQRRADHLRPRSGPVSWGKREAAGSPSPAGLGRRPRRSRTRLTVTTTPTMVRVLGNLVTRLP